VVSSYVIIIRRMVGFLKGEGLGDLVMCSSQIVQYTNRRQCTMKVLFVMYV